MPEGHQFQNLREIVLVKLSPGLQESVMSGFWYYLLLCELTHWVQENEYSWAQRDPQRREAFEALGAVFRGHAVGAQAGFAEKLLTRINLITERYKIISAQSLSPGQLTEALFTTAVPELERSLMRYLSDKDDVWVLVDNIDKGWPMFGLRPEDVVIVRGLLDGARKLTQNFSRERIDFHSLIFLRRDIYDNLIVRSADAGKDTAIVLDWNDPELFKLILRARIEASGELDGAFDEIWAQLFDLQVDGIDSFQYIVTRTLMRPREFLRFLHSAIEVGINRSHSRITGDDIKRAEDLYSEELLAGLESELRDLFPGVLNPLYPFLGCPAILRRDEVIRRLEEAAFPNPENALNVLIWFGFLGIGKEGGMLPRFAYEVQHNVNNLLAMLDKDTGRMVVQSAFRPALECS